MSVYGIRLFFHCWCFLEADDSRPRPRLLSWCRRSETSASQLLTLQTFFATERASLFEVETYCSYVFLPLFIDTWTGPIFSRNMYVPVQHMFINRAALLVHTIHVRGRKILGQQLVACKFWYRHFFSCSQLSFYRDVTKEIILPYLSHSQCEWAIWKVLSKIHVSLGG